MHNLAKIREENPFVVFTIISIITISIDQLTKAIAQPLSLSVLNTDLALKINLGFNPLLVILLMWILLGYFIWKNQYLNWISGLIIGGGASNLIDRFVWGGVHDWLPIPILGGVNNLADWAICIGATAYIIVQWKNYQNDRKQR